MPSGEDVMPIEIPEANENIEMSSVVPTIDMPQVSFNQSDSNTLNKLESVGMPLFAKDGGIASLIGTRKPKQMVA